MRVVILFRLVLMGAASAAVEISKGYHDEIGIPLAEKIRIYEEGLKREDDSDNRIIGGALAPAGAFPYFGGLLVSFWNIAGNSVCGSSLLTANRLVTAAHCWFDGTRQASQFTVILGSTSLYWGGIRIVTNQVYMHPQYTSSNLNNDIAMIYLPTSVACSATIQPIDIPNPSELWETFVGLWATAAGFGRTSDAQPAASVNVSHVTVQVITVAQCQAIFGSNYVVQSTICTSGAGGVGTCGGDSGGPLALSYNGRTILIGISSFAAQNACERGFPSGYARTTSFSDFIVQHL